MYLWFFTADILICYQYSLDLNTFFFCFGAVKAMSRRAYYLILYQEQFFDHDWSIDTYIF